ncbi:unnamed protein product [Schistosoma curassoni]|uniref:Uncharacterized protein n=1 Tax=Schistosoma curassoni TaxID=6186 RepID=A0A183JMB7_9TREM|nr:unnamed protein product [Schistosoma curassoni]
MDYSITKNINKNKMNTISNTTTTTTTTNNNNVTKKTNDCRAAYKYLTWREKDRRRRFREEWKHLWLVIPYGRYEVSYLLMLMYLEEGYCFFNILAIIYWIKLEYASF